MLVFLAVLTGEHSGNYINLQIYYSLGFHVKCDKLKVNLGRMDTSVIFNLTILRHILILAGFAQWLED